MFASTHFSVCSVSLLVPAGKPPVLLFKGSTFTSAHLPSLSCLNTRLLQDAPPPTSSILPSLPDCCQQRETTGGCKLTTVSVHSMATFSWSLILLLSFSKLPLGIVYANGLHFDPECIQSFTPPGFFT